MTYKGFELVTLTTADLDGAMALSTEAGWNQALEEWRLVITHGHTIGLRAQTGRLIASVTALDYGPAFGWLAMLLVAQDHRRQGIGNYLFQQGVNHLREAGRVPALDATPAGEALYERNGFHGLYRIYRMARPGRILRSSPEEAGPSGASLGDGASGRAAGPAGESTAGPAGEQRAGDGRETGAGDTGAGPAALDTLLEMDAEVTGFEREYVMRGIAGRPDARLFVRTQAGRSVSLIRRGHHAWQIGPVFSESSEGALRVVEDAVFAAGEDSVYIDVVASRGELTVQLEHLGFEIQRPFSRMVQTAEATAAPPFGLFATPGPEYG
jgi:GNAT superfamily N-acetyltransferase